MLYYWVEVMLKALYLSVIVICVLSSVFNYRNGKSKISGTRWQVISSMAFSFFCVIYLEYHGMEELHPLTMVISAAICMIGFDGWKPIILDSNGNEINHAICYLYSIRIILGMMSSGVVLASEVAWCASMIVMIFQLLLCLGDGLGYGKRINSNLAGASGSINDALLQFTKLRY